MAGSIREVMTEDPRSVDLGDSLVEAARLMREHDTGAAIVTEGEQVTGIVTDRDIVVRAVAEGKDPEATKVEEACSRNPSTLSPDDSPQDAVRLMREQDVRRVPVVEDGRAVGIVSIGDLAEVLDEDSALADISEAPANN